MIPLPILNDIQFYLGNDKDVNSLVLIEPLLDRYYHDLIKEIKDKPPEKILKLKISSSLNLNLFVNLVQLDCVGRVLTSLPSFPNLRILFGRNDQLENLP
jgi:hypothetical protein